MPRVRTYQNLLRFGGTPVLSSGEGVSVDLRGFAEGALGAGSVDLARSLYSKGSFNSHFLRAFT